MNWKRILLTGLAISFALAQTKIESLIASQKIIIDTDFARPPQDDALAVLLALKSPELEILGLTTVAGNFSREQATSDLLRVLEIVGREDIPVYEGANLPLVHRPTEFARNHWGEWYSDEIPPQPPGGFASIQPASERAADFLVRAVNSHPGQVSIIAIGPLTNVAIAISQDPDFSTNVKKLYIMGGAIASLPDGAGNITPNAEFNFWVDPESAHTVLRSKIPIELSPLNVSRKTSFTQKHLDKILSVDNRVTGLLSETMKEVFHSGKISYFMYDQVTVASVIDPTLVTKKHLVVDVDCNPGINYGVSVGGLSPWPGSDGAQVIEVQYDLDWKRFISLFISRLTSD